MSGTSLQRLIGGKLPDEPLDADAALCLYNESLKDPGVLHRAASAVRSASKGRIISFSSKAFVSVTRLCRDTCTYCTYKAEPAGEPFMSLDEVEALLREARRRGCVEALFVAGEHPEQRYDGASEWLEREGLASTPEYIARCSELAIKYGMFPHTNAGNLTEHEIELISKTNASIGLMLENSSERLAGHMMPHQGAPSKLPKERMRALERAGEAHIPTTTGILVGIGETPQEAVESLAAIDKLDKRYGHIQEIIIQNFQPEPQTVMHEHEPADPKYFATIVALARLMMPEMNIQAPPNLSPRSYPTLIGAGINDWGGISPVTPDHVNPKFAWPQIRDVEVRTQAAGFELRCRFPTYPEYLNMMPQTLCEMASEFDDGDGYVKKGRWEAGML